MYCEPSIRPLWRTCNLDLNPGARAVQGRDVHCHLDSCINEGDRGVERKLVQDMGLHWVLAGSLLCTG